MARKIKKKKTPAVTAPPAKQEKGGKMTKKQIIITAVASVLIVALVAVGVFFIVRAITDTGDVDFVNDNLSKYISIPKSAYSSVVVEGPFETYDEEDLERKINSLLAENKDKEPQHSGYTMTSVPITLGDIVEFVYRGYMIDEDGRENDFAGGTNLDERTVVEVGTNRIIDEASSDIKFFIPGFVDQFIGKAPNQYESFSKIDDGEVTSDNVIYLTYKAAYPDGTSKQVTGERIDLSLDDLDSVYGEGFTAFILGGADSSPAKIGEALGNKTFPFGEGTAAYYDLKIEYATACEGSPLTISVVFPADYSQESLRGKQAYFDVYLHSAIIYDTPEYNEAFITEKLLVTADDLSAYEGEGIVEKHRNMLADEVRAEIEDTNNTVKMDAMWKVLKEAVIVHSYPEKEVQKYYDSYYQEVTAEYSKVSEYYADIDAFAKGYLGLAEGADWVAALTDVAEDAVLEKLIFYYIMQENDIFPSDEEMEKLYEDIVNDHLEYFIEFNADELSKYEGEEYDAEVAKLKEEMLEYYAYEYFEENIYYNYATEKIIELFIKEKK